MSFHSTIHLYLVDEVLLLSKDLAEDFNRSHAKRLNIMAEFVCDF